MMIRPFRRAEESSRAYDSHYVCRGFSRSQRNGVCDVRTYVITSSFRPVPFLNPTTTPPPVAAQAMGWVELGLPTEPVKYSGGATNAKLTSLYTRYAVAAMVGSMSGAGGAGGLMGMLGGEVGHSRCDDTRPDHRRDHRSMSSSSSGLRERPIR